MTEGDQSPGSSLDPIGRMIAESGIGPTKLAERMTQFLAREARTTVATPDSPGRRRKDHGAAPVLRQTVAHYRSDPVVNTPAPEMMRALAWAVGVSPQMVVHLFTASHEQYLYALMGIAASPPRDPESLAHALADRLDAIPDLEERKRLIWAWRTLVEASESQQEKPTLGEGADVADEKSVGDRLRQLGDRIIEEIGAGATEEDAQAAIDLLARRKKDREREQEQSD